MKQQLDSIDTVLRDLAAGKPVIIVDDEGRENEGDVIIGAEFATQDTINFMVKEARGIVCTPMLDRDLKRLQIGQMVTNNTDNHETAFTVSVDHVDTTTGVSPAERAYTIQALLRADATPGEFRRPGHVFPLRYKEGGVLARRGHTEASIDLCRLAGLREAAVICEITKDDGSMARLDDLYAFADKFGLSIASVEQLVEYRKRFENMVRIEAQSKLPTKFGDFKLVVFSNDLDNKEHLAIIKGDVKGASNVLLRMHSECLTGDVLGSKRCDCGEQLEKALRTIEEAGQGVVLYLRQEGRGIGLTNKIKAYALQEQGMDTVEANESLGFPADMRDYAVAAQMIRALGIESINLLTNNPKKRADLERWGVTVSKRVPVIVKPNPFNKGYLKTKAVKMGHMFDDKK